MGGTNDDAWMSNRSTHLEDVVVDEALCNGDLLRHNHNVLQILIWYIVQLLAMICRREGDPPSQHKSRTRSPI